MDVYLGLATSSQLLLESEDLTAQVLKVNFFNYESEGFRALTITLVVCVELNWKQ